MTHAANTVESKLRAFEDLLAWRRDVRRFQTKPVSEAKLVGALDMVKYAPSVGNSQPWRWVRVEEPSRRAAIEAHFQAANDRARETVPDENKALYASLKLAGLREAPVHFAVFCAKGTQQGGGLGRQTMPETLEYSVVCAVMTFWLAAQAVGLGVGWVSILEPADVKEILNVPEDWTLVAYLCVGYSKEAHLDPELERAGWQDRVWSIDNVILR